jgi:hypothetical protein
LAQTNEDKRSSYLASWQDEIESAALYRALSEAENNPGLVRVYARLAEVEEEHATFWEEKLKKAGQEVPPAGWGGARGLWRCWRGASVPGS